MSRGDDKLDRALGGDGDAQSTLDDLASRFKFRFDSRECKILCAEWGEQAVEDALIFIAHAKQRRGLRVKIQPTYEMVREVLEAVHGRLKVGSVKADGEDGDLFYHFPTEVDQNVTK